MSLCSPTLSWQGIGDELDEPIRAHAHHRDGSEAPLALTVTPLRIADRRFLSVTARDASERSRSPEELAHEASHDALTGLPNRTVFLDRLEHALARARRSRRSLAVVFLDLDDFKLVNDTRGHDVGDLLLVALTPRLASALRPGDTIARFGGDEFVVLCEDLQGEADAIGITRRITEACSTPVRVGDYEHTVTVSAGIALVTDPNMVSPSGLLRDADAAMYRAKAQGKGRIEVFDEGMRARLIERIAIESSLRKALDRGELCVFYQPVMSLRHNKIVSVEALLRWRHPHRGLLEPSTFIGVAESSGLIVQIGEWVLEEACRQAVRWRDSAAPGTDPIHVSVNLSAQQLIRSDIADSVARVLARTGLEPGLLDLEITEGMLLQDLDTCAHALRELKALGIRLVVDDFGTGYSSLSYLKRLTIDALKIDRSFVDGLSREDEDGSIVGAVLSMADALDIRVTAEGVETRAQLSQLRSHGCESVQGFLFARPAPAREITALIGAAGLGDRITT
jgi:diguanylate cyclase (GGDEF)-like protein